MDTTQEYKQEIRRLRAEIQHRVREMEDSAYHEAWRGLYPAPEGQKYQPSATRERNLELAAEIAPWRILWTVLMQESMRVHAYA